jgi:signal peptidase
MVKRSAAEYSSREESERQFEQTHGETFPDKKKADCAERPLTKGRRIGKIIFDAVYSAVVLALVVMLCLGLQARANGELPSLFGYYVFIVKTGSMAPTLPIGCFILSKAPDNPAEIQPGTIATFRFEDGTVVTHRIVGRNVGMNGTVTYATQGDNPVNDVDPESLTPDRVIGVFVLKITLPKLWSTK